MRKTLAHASLTEWQTKERKAGERDAVSDHRQSHSFSLPSPVPTDSPTKWTAGEEKPAPAFAGQSLVRTAIKHPLTGHIHTVRQSGLFNPL